MGVLDLGILRGFGIYEGITSFSGEPFHFNDHWERFQKSARGLGLTLPYTETEIEDAMRTLITHNTEDGRANLRMVLTGGEAFEGLEYVPGHETLFITAAPHASLPQELYTQGASLITHEHERFMPEVKTIHYITAVMLQGKRKAARAIEILYTHNDQVLECSTSNVFMVKDAIIVTPDKDVLKGITRKVVLELAGKAYSTEERPIQLSALLDADEVFITSSFKDIMPITSIDGHTIGNGLPGPITRDLIERLTQYENSL